MKSWPKTSLVDTTRFPDLPELDLMAAIIEQAKNDIVEYVNFEFARRYETGRWAAQYLHKAIPKTEYDTAFCFFFDPWYKMDCGLTSNEIFIELSFDPDAARVAVHKFFVGQFKDDPRKLEIYTEMKHRAEQKNATRYINVTRAARLIGISRATLQSWGHMTPRRGPRVYKTEAGDRRSGSWYRLDDVIAFRDKRRRKYEKSNNISGI